MTPDLSPQHHPSIETLTAFAAGTQRAGFDVVTAAHVRACAQCRAQVAALECIGGMALSSAPSAPLGQDSLARTLARLNAPAPAPAERTLDDLLNAAKRRWVAPGLWIAKIDTPHAEGDRVYLLGAKPGAATAKHSHFGLEYTQVLHGALADDGVVYRAGDFVERDDHHMHHPSAVGEEQCVCLFATCGRLRAVGVLGRIAFAFAGV